MVMVTSCGLGFNAASCCTCGGSVLWVVPVMSAATAPEQAICPAIGDDPRTPRAASVSPNSGSSASLRPQAYELRWQVSRSPNLNDSSVPGSYLPPGESPSPAE